MEHINNIFFELIQVSLGSRPKLSKMVTQEEWVQLFELAKKQSLIGVCFAGVQRLGTESVETIQIKNDEEVRVYDALGIGKQLYINWMGAAMKIQRRNEVMYKRCAKLKNEFEASGFHCCVLKGQGMARLYNESLSNLRQSGDIDAWIWPKGDWTLTHNQRVKHILGFLHLLCECSHTTYHNTSVKVFSDTEVEVHYTPSWLYSPIENRRLQKWFEQIAPREMKNDFSSLEFNLVYILLHIYRHLFGEGVGLRQVLDYYFVLQAVARSNNQRELFTDAMQTLHNLGISKFASALMYVMQVTFGLKPENMLADPDPKEGAFLLNEILLAGNFGKYDTRFNGIQTSSLWHEFILHVKRNIHFLSHYPREVIWCPFWKIWHQLWLRTLSC